MITVNGLIAVLFAMLSVINSDTSIPTATKEKVNAAVVAAVRDNFQPQAQAVPAGVTVLTPGTKTVEVGSPRKASQGKLAQLSVGPVNSDDTRTISAVLNDAEYAQVQLYREAPRGWELIDRKFARSENEQMFWIEAGSYKWEAVSLDAAGLTMGTSTGKFIIRDN